jgi:hypothetical protein
MAVDERADPVVLPRKGALLLLIPVAMIPLVFVAWGLMIWAGLAGRPASGPEVDIGVTACPEARDVLLARAADMGLTPAVEARPDGFVLHTRMPEDPESAASVPRALAPPGRFEVRGGDQVLATNADVTEATIRLDLSLSPATLIRLQPAAAQRVAAFVRGDEGGQIEFWLDGQKVGYQVNREVSANELEIWVQEGGDRARLQVAAERGVVIDHPLPCPVAVD